MIIDDETRKLITRSPKLKLSHVKRSDGLWYWKCPECGVYLAPHECGRGKWKVLQSKGAASRHLEKHDYFSVNHGRDIKAVKNEGRFVCKSCGNATLGRPIALSLSLADNNPPTKDNHVRYCMICNKWLTNDEIRAPKFKPRKVSNPNIKSR